MGTTLLTTEMGSLMATCDSLFDGNHQDGDGRTLTGTAVALTASTVTSAAINQQTKHEMFRNHSLSYVESMSDEELEKALVQMDLILGEEPLEKDVKTL